MPRLDAIADPHERGDRHQLASGRTRVIAFELIRVQAVAALNLLDHLV